MAIEASKTTKIVQKREKIDQKEKKIYFIGLFHSVNDG